MENDFPSIIILNYTYSICPHHIFDIPLFASIQASTSVSLGLADSKWKQIVRSVDEQKLFLLTCSEISVNDPQNNCKIVAGFK